MLFVLWLKKNVGLKCFNKMEKFNYFKSTCLFLFKDCVSLLKVGTIKSQLMFSWVRFCCCTVLSLVRARAQHGWRENGFVQSFSYFTIYYYRFISKSLYLDVLWDVCKWINFNFSVFFGWGWGALTFYGGSLLYVWRRADYVSTDYKLFAVHILMSDDDHSSMRTHIV